MSLSADRGAKCGFTLIELLVTIGVLGILLGLLLPTLASSRGAAREAVARANLHALVQVFHQYCSESQSFFPINDPVGLRAHACRDVRIDFGFWGIRYGWPSLLEGIAPWHENPSLYTSPGARRDLAAGCGWPSSYSYSLSFVARPELWRAGAPHDESLLRGTRDSEVDAPAAKVILWDWELPYRSGELRHVGPDLDEPTPMGFVDGHVDKRVQAQAAAAVVTPFAADGAGSARLHNTPDGVRGRDY